MVVMTSESVIRGLKYLRMLNDSNVRPLAGFVDAFVEAPLTTPTSDFAAFTARLNIPRYAAGNASGDKADIKISSYLLTTGMAESVSDSGALELTEIGLGFLRGIEKEEQATSRVSDSVIEVVGRLEDPVVYARLLTEIDKQHDALIVDPYLQSTDLLTLLELPSVKRVLTKDTRIRGETAEVRSRRFAIALGARADVELKYLLGRGGELHDRLVIPTAGEALMIGTSLGGSQMTVISHLSEDTTTLLRAHYEELWAQGDKLDPIERLPVQNTVPSNQVESPDPLQPADS
jgi:hypothetical protein